MKQFRTLSADDVEARVARSTGKGLSLLIYKNARVDMRILDETVGPENWQREHYECKGNLFCRIGIKCGDEWIWKSDCGSESNTEAEKGEASDSFKRAGFNWGIGRELYTAPFIWIPAVDKNGQENYAVDQRGKPSDRFVVTMMKIADHRVTALMIENARKRKTVFAWGDLLDEYKCSVCGKPVRKDIAIGSMEANRVVFCSGTCRRKADEVANR